jgi:uncharacterized protein YxeA
MMKKILLFILAIFVMVLFSVPVIATGQTSSDGSLTMGSTDHNTSVRLSANVEAAYKDDGNGASYSAATYNPKGVGRAYGTASDTTYIFYDDVATGTSIGNVVTTLNSGDSSDFPSSDWTKIGE